MVSGTRDTTTEGTAMIPHNPMLNEFLVRDHQARLLDEALSQGLVREARAARKAQRLVRRQERAEARAASRAPRAAALAARIASAVPSTRARH